MRISTLITFLTLTFLVCSFNSTELTAQMNFSFEESDGYIPGNIAGQNGWFGGFSNETFLVSTALASEGSQSLELANTGASQGFEDFLSSGDFTPVVESEVATIVDVYITDPEVMDSESYYTIQATDNQASLAFLIEFNHDNTIGILLQQPGGTFAMQIMEDFNYSREVWFELKVVNNFTTGVVNYYIDDQLLYEDTIGNLATHVNTCFFSIIDNAGAGSAFFDNLSIDDAILSTEDIEFNSEIVSLYPNPTSKILNLKSETIIGQVQLYDLSGNKILEDFINTESYSLDISGLSSGVYLATITSKDRVSTARVIIN